MKIKLTPFATVLSILLFLVGPLSVVLKLTPDLVLLGGLSTVLGIFLHAMPTLTPLLLEIKPTNNKSESTSLPVKEPS